jgi:uncharacterized membrane protein
MEDAAAHAFTKRLTAEEFADQAKENTLNETIKLCKDIARKELEKEDNDKFIKYFEKKYLDECLFDTTNISNDLDKYIHIINDESRKLKRDNEILQETLDDNKDMMRETNEELDETERKNMELQSVIQANKIRITKLRNKCREKNLKIKWMTYALIILMVNTLTSIINNDFNIVGSMIYMIYYFVGFYFSFYSSSLFYFLGNESGYLMMTVIVIVHSYFFVKLVRRRYQYNVAAISEGIKNFR